MKHLNWKGKKLFKSHSLYQSTDIDFEILICLFRVVKSTCTNTLFVIFYSIFFLHLNCLYYFLLFLFPYCLSWWKIANVCFQKKNLDHFIFGFKIFFCFFHFFYETTKKNFNVNRLEIFHCCDWTMKYYIVWLLCLWVISSLYKTQSQNLPDPYLSCENNNRGRERGKLNVSNGSIVDPFFLLFVVFLYLKLE